MLNRPFWGCALYVAVIGFVMRFVGAWYNRERFSPDSALYRPKSWEKNGEFYKKLGIRRWKDRVPDVSRRAKKLYTKKVDMQKSPQNLRRLIQETCVAECVHYQLILLSLPVTWIYKGLGGWVIFAMCVTGNLVFVAIQRYNRPRLMRALERLEKRGHGQPEQSLASVSLFTEKTV